MRLKTSFSFPFHRIVPALAGAGWFLAMGAVMAGGAFLLDAVHLRNETPALQKQLEDWRRKPVQPPVSMPGAVDLEGLGRQITALNSLGVGRRSVEGALVRLENLLPSGARLVSFQDERDGEIQLAVEARRLDEFSRFLESLEGDGSFSGVNLSKQTQSGKDGWIQFSVELREE